MGVSKLLITCLGEDTPEFHFRILTLFKTLRAFGGQLNRSKSIALFVERVDKNIKRKLNGMGVQVKIVQPYESELQRHCNKIRMLELEESYDILIALDCDTAITRDFSSCISKTAIRRCDSMLDPLTIEEWKYLYQFYKLPIPKNEAEIHANSAILFIPKPQVEKLRRSWMKFARQLTEDFFDNDRSNQIGKHKYYTDQFALSLALAEQNLKSDLLPPEFNIHINGKFQKWADQLHPYLLSYHHNVTKDWKLEFSGMTVPDSYIKEVNALLAQE